MVASEMGPGVGEHRAGRMEEPPSPAEKCVPHQYWGARPQGPEDSGTLTCSACLPSI